MIPLVKLVKFLTNKRDSEWVKEVDIFFLLQWTEVPDFFTKLFNYLRYTDWYDRVVFTDRVAFKSYLQ